MAAPTHAPAALGAETEDERECMFCGQRLANRHAGFVDHVTAKPECRAAYDAWLERLDQDRPGG